MRAATRRSLGIADDALVLLFSGKLSARKGVELIPPAVRALPEELRSRAVILWLGDGDERRALAASLAAAPTVPAQFVGFRPQSALSAYYHAADLLLLPSRHSETWGLVVNDALHHGLPCVVSDRVGCAPDLVVPGVTGTTFAGDSAAALAAAICTAAVLTRRPEVREACRLKVAPYSVVAAAEGIAEAYAAATAAGAESWVG